MLTCYPRTRRYSVPPTSNHGPCPALGFFPLASLYLYNWSPVLPLIPPSPGAAQVTGEACSPLRCPSGCRVRACSAITSWYLCPALHPGYKQMGTWCKYRSITKEERPRGNARTQALPGLRGRGMHQEAAALRTRGSYQDSLSRRPQEEDYVKPSSHALTLLYHGVFQPLFPLSIA